MSVGKHNGQLSAQESRIYYTTFYKPFARHSTFTKYVDVDVRCSYVHMYLPFNINVIFKNNVKSSTEFFLYAKAVKIKAIILKVLS